MFLLVFLPYMNVTKLVQFCIFYFNLHLISLIFHSSYLLLNIMKNCFWYEDTFEYQLGYGSNYKFFCFQQLNI